MTKPLEPSRFMRWFTISTLTGIALVVALVVIVDPYDQYRVVTRPGFNLIKPGLTRHQSEIKLTQAVEMRADALILGHSRAEVGFDPEAPVFVRQGLSAYNLAIPGAGISNARGQVEYLHQIGIKPKVVVLGVEFLDFMEAPQNAASTILHQHPANDRHPVTHWFWRFDSLFSLGSVKDTIRTLFIQYDNEAAIMTSRGFNPLNEYGPIMRREGYYPLFRQRAQENTKTYLKKAKGSLSSADFDHLRAILDIAAKSGSDVKLIIYPYHAQILALFEETRLWSSFWKWKDLLVREVSAAKQRHPGARIALFDFSGYGNYNCEKIPAKGDRTTATRWYWEAGHFKKELGDIVLESVFSNSANTFQMINVEQDKPDTFGFQLNESNTILNLRRIYQERSRCMKSHPALFVEAIELVAGA
ncbi:hypothetical protein SAMN05216386_1771 [Nitrosospira briensis]|uniref:Uncharacterized protein n=1 Tax=Nitrosospira briensis TaxID=35799 RepID=A0A1I5BQV2_9PROT|nr:hypothetical protein [Nitrosospira briensis]SFN76821.1 hypothetical protein SAMN05216386_1771 [Nitrosospira briensis]